MSDDREGAKPGAEQFSARAVHRAVLGETLQHPLTILPAAVSALSALYMGVISFDPRSFAVGFGSALFGAAAWVVNYYFRGERFAEAHLRKLREQRERFKRVEAESLLAKCRESGDTELAESVADLTRAFEKLRGYLATRAERGSLDALRFDALAEDTYQEGIAILQTAYDSRRALAAIEPEKLRREMSDWQRTLDALQKQPGADEARSNALRTKIESHSKRLALYEERSNDVHKLLAESEVLESALETAYLEVLDLGRDERGLSRGAPADKLANAVDAAKRVEERLRSTRDTAKEDELYRRHGDAEQ